MIKENDERTSFYTGLPSWSVLLHVFLFLSPYVTPAVLLSLEDEFCLVLMHLKLGLLMEDLATRFAVITTTEACQEMLISHSQLVMALLSFSLTVQMWCRYYLFWAVEM